MSGQTWAMGMAGIPKALIDDLASNHLNGRWHDKADALADGAGAYALLLKLAKPLRLKRSGKPWEMLTPGWYVYTGNARGPGGLPARIRRHLRKNKKIHWHIDQLTRHANVIAAQAVPEGDECDVAAWLSSSFAFDSVVPGFGSSDCPICLSHLLVWRPPEQRPI